MYYPYSGGGQAQVYVTPRVKKIVDVANEEANRLKDDYVSTEHLLLALSMDRDGAAGRLLERVRADARPHPPSLARDPRRAAGDRSPMPKASTECSSATRAT